MTETPEATIARLTAELAEARASQDRLSELHHAATRDKNSFVAGEAAQKARAEAAEAERDAMIAAAYEAAVNGFLKIIKTAQYESGAIDLCGDEVDEEIVAPIRALTPASATAAYTAAIRAAHVAGMREANTEHAKRTIAALCEWLDEDEDNGALLLSALPIETVKNLRAILAAATAKEKAHD